MKIELQVEKLYYAESCQSLGRPSSVVWLLSSSSNPRYLNKARKEAAFFAGVVVYKII